MDRKPISLSLSILSLTALGWAIACSSSKTETTSSTTSSSTSTTTTTNAGSQASSSTSTSSGSAVAGCSPSVLTIDNQTSPSGKQISWAGAPSGDHAGYWYTYEGTGTSGDAGDIGTIGVPGQGTLHDGGFPPVAFTAIGPGSDAGIPAIASDLADAASAPGYPEDASGTSTQTFAACVSGTTAAAPYSFGAEGFYFAGIPGVGDAGDTKTSVDISCHTGIQFWIYNALTQATGMSVAISDVESQPNGGYCDPTDVDAASACNSPPIYDNSPNSLVITPGWQFVQIPFALFGVNTYYGYMEGSPPDLTKAEDVQWQVNVGMTPAPVQYNFCVADVSFF